MNKKKSQKIHVLLHDDWEIYGDGSGDPYSLMFEPAKRLLDICEKHNAKYTFNAEVGQQLQMLNATGSKWKNIAAEWESIMKNAIRRGHDVQLHLHPQWIGASLAQGAWQLDYSNWSAGNIDDEILNKWICKGKQYLESLLQSVDPNYNVTSFRAGGWLCQPSYGLYKALKNNNILCDSSVSKGRFTKYEDGSYVDFRNAVSRFEPWEVEPGNFAEEAVSSGIYELPVYAEVTTLPNPIYLLQKAFRPWHYFKIFKYLKTNPPPDQYIPIAIDRGNAKAHYGNFGYMHSKHLLSYIRKASSHNYFSDIPPHLIYLTHSKDFIDYNNFDSFLNNLKKLNNVKFSTTRQFVNHYLSS